jgi:hypothetical protein
MDDFNRFSPMPPLPETNGDAPADMPQPGGPAPAAMPSDAVAKFQSCRWRCDPEAGAFCTHRDVLPFAGKEGFVADSWCPDCGFYKLRRTPKKRDYNSY